MEKGETKYIVCEPNIIYGVMFVEHVFKNRSIASYTPLPRRALRFDTELLAEQWLQEFLPTGEVRRITNSLGNPEIPHGVCPKCGSPQFLFGCTNDECPLFGSYE